MFSRQLLSHGHSGVDDWNLIIFKQCETHEQVKERETFW